MRLIRDDAKGASGWAQMGSPFVDFIVAETQKNAQKCDQEPRNFLLFHIGMARRLIIPSLIV
ncbi:hypothetical protein [Bradyrhizobium australafricanum]|uniref:hypothetical protein n=1 Tax=Bradyrhizobium australafricanum TaxID=2821406 RepID=UPI001CE37C7D|nr:hypothetical protein [Bradyrhizobium australafricanum]